MESSPLFSSLEQICKYFSALGYKGQVWKGNPFGLLYLCLPDEPDRDDVSDYCWDCSSQQVKRLQCQLLSLTVITDLHSLVADLSPELAAMLLAAVIGGYTLIGGLGATFYVSYFNTALIFVLILMLVIEVFYNPSNNPENPFGSSEAVFDYISCWKTPDEDMGNKGGSYLTFFSSGGLIFGIVNIVGNFGKC